MYRPASDCYKLLAAATISLIPLFEDSVLRKFCSEIMLKSVDTGVEMCTLRYEIEVSQPISDSFKKFKVRLVFGILYLLYKFCKTLTCFPLPLINLLAYVLDKKFLTD